MLFAIAQLFINYKRGVVSSPFFHYGMYSDNIQLPDTIHIYEIEVNNKTLKPFHFSAQEWDKLMLPLYEYTNLENHNNELYRIDISRLLTKLYLSPKPVNFVVEKQPLQFLQWYKSYTEKIIGKTITSFNIFYASYIVVDSKMKKINQQSILL